MKPVMLAMALIVPGLFLLGLELRGTEPDAASIILVSVVAVMLIVVAIFIDRLDMHERHARNEDIGGRRDSGVCDDGAYTP